MDRHARSRTPPQFAPGELKRLADKHMGYYREKLSGTRLRECYEIASPRVQQYFHAEIRHVLTRIEAADAVLELGCGYGRVVMELARVADWVVGIDTSAESLALARQLAESTSNCEFLEMDAVDLHFPDGEFDVVVCIQNGICAFGVDKERLLREAIRVTRPAGRVILSTYAERFWPHRLEWFEQQAERGLVGDIDHDATGNGVIVCKDGFRAETVSPADLKMLCAQIGVAPNITPTITPTITPNITPIITEVDGSSVFCEFTV